MFDIGFMEMLVVAIIALLVLGAEQAAGAIRTVSLTVGRIKRSFSGAQPGSSVRSVPTKFVSSCTTSASSPNWKNRA